MSSLKNKFEKIRQGEFQEVFMALESALLFLDLLEAEELNFKANFARILGRQMKPILIENQEILEYIQSVIKKLRGDFSKEEVEELYLANPDDQKIQRWYLIQVLEDEIET